MPGTWTYTFAPSSVSRDAVRLLTGQTSSVDDQLLYNEEITYCLSQRATVYGAASLGCEVLAGKYAAYPQRESIGALGLTWGDRANSFIEKAKSLRSQQAMVGVSPYAGGISKSDMQVDTQDTDRVPMPFTIGQTDNPRTGNNSTST